MSGRTSYVTLKCAKHAITVLRYMFGSVYLHVLIYFHDSGQRPNGLLAKFSSASLGAVTHVRFLIFAVF